MVTIALYNLKGGVGKTASCVNFSYLAAADGYKTLLWDLDQQGSSTFYYNVKPKAHTSARKLVARNADLANVIMDSDFEMLDVIPADESARAMEHMIEEMKGNKSRLKSLLKQLSGDYDFVFLDCPPGYSALTENIFQASDIVLMPVIPTTLSVRTYEMVKDYFSEKEADLSKLMCFFTMVDLRKNLHHEVMSELYKDKRFFSNYIPNLSDVEKMGVRRSAVMEFANSSHAAKSYRGLWTEIKDGIL